MTDNAEIPADRSSPTGDDKEPALNGESNGHPGPKNAGRGPSDRERKIRSRIEVFLFAFLSGSIVTAICAAVMFVIWTDQYALPERAYLWLFLGGFLGGGVSGFNFAQDINRFRGRFLWLAASSPALPIWIVTLVLLVGGEKIDNDVLVGICLACVGALAGVVAGQYAGCRWKQAETHSQVAFWKGYVRALLRGAGASLLVSCCISYPISIIFSVSEGVYPGGLGVVLIFLGPPFIGGLVSGRSLVGILDDRRWRPVYLAFASPATPLIVYSYVVSRPISGSRADALMVLLGWATLSVIGALTGYYAALHLKRRSAPEKTTADQTPHRGEVTDDRS